MPITLQDCRTQDANDPLRSLREQFTLPAGVIYLDGNSLGALPKATAAHVAQVVEQEWGQGLITSWNQAGWISLPQRLTVGRIAAGGGADAGRFQRLALIDPDAAEPAPLTVLANWPTGLHSPVVLAARRRPVALPSVLPADRLGQPGQTGLLVCQDVRRTLNTGAGWDHIKAIRVLAGAGQTLRSSHSYIVHAGSTVTELGTVPIAPDGSFAVEVPADTAIAFQAVDAEGRSELNEMSWIYVRAGERRSCVGCHQPRSDAPPRGLPLSATVPAMRLVPETEPFQFRGNNAAVTGLMELQFDRYREVAGFNRHDGGL